MSNINKSIKTISLSTNDTKVVTTLTCNINNNNHSLFNRISDFFTYNYSINNTRFTQILSTNTIRPLFNSMKQFYMYMNLHILMPLVLLFSYFTYIINYSTISIINLFLILSVSVILSIFINSKLHKHNLKLMNKYNYKKKQHNINNTSGYNTSVTFKNTEEIITTFYFIKYSMLRFRYNIQNNSQYHQYYIIN